MTLADLASFVCGKVNQTEAEDIAACKGFLKRRFLLLWAHALWKDSLVSYTQTISPDVDDYTVQSTWLPTKGILLVPPLIERVLAVRTDTRKLNVQRPEYYYRIDYDAFSKNGAPTEFHLLPACVWEFEDSETLLLSPGAVADQGVIITMDVLDSDLVGITRTSTELIDDPVITGISTERIDVVLKNATDAAVGILADGIQCVSVAATDTAAKLRQRIRLVTIPETNSVTLRILGKRSAPTFSNDLDQPGLTGVENTLLALAQGDMLQRERHYAKAQALYQEAALLLEQLKAEEMVQMAHEQRVIPECGYAAEDWDNLAGFSF